MKKKKHVKTSGIIENLNCNILNKIKPIPTKVDIVNYDKKNPIRK